MCPAREAVCINLHESLSPCPQYAAVTEPNLSVLSTFDFSQYEIFCPSVAVVEAERRMEASEFGRRSAVGELEDRRTAEKTGRGDGRMKADEAGTTMALRGEHDARSASAQEEGRLN